jgi:hypothetical protein
MANLLVGIQGSGKSYKAVYDIYHGQGKYFKIFTNIDGIENDEFALKLDFNFFKEQILTDCYKKSVLAGVGVEYGDMTYEERHELVTGGSASYDEALKILKKSHILASDASEDSRTLIVVDEAQNYFDKNDPVLKWFITQHRHLYIELYLITQVITNLSPVYKLFNVIYEAKPPIKQLNKRRISYYEYASLPLSPANRSRSFSLPKEQEVFAVYKSGDKVESPNILLKFIFIFIGLLVVLGFTLYFFKSSFFSHAQKSKDNVVKEQTSRVDINVTTVKKTLNYHRPQKKVHAPADGVRLYEFILYESTFRVRGIDGYYPRSFLAYLKKNYFVEEISVIDGDQLIVKDSNGSVTKILYFNRKKAFVVCYSNMENVLVGEQTNKLEEELK